MIFVSAARAVGLITDPVGPWQAVSVANLSYLIPSSPGAIGTFEWAVKTSLMSHGALEAPSALFGLALHAWLLISVTGAGGIILPGASYADPQSHASTAGDRDTAPASCRWMTRCLA